MSGPIVWVVNDTSGHPLASVDATNVVRTLDMDAIRRTVANVLQGSPTATDGLALVVLYAYQLGRTQA